MVIKVKKSQWENGRPSIWNQICLNSRGSSSNYTMLLLCCKWGPTSSNNEKPRGCLWVFEYKRMPHARCLALGVTKGLRAVRSFDPEHPMTVRTEDEPQLAVVAVVLAPGESPEWCLSLSPATIEKEMRKLFNIPAERETRLWNKYMSNTYEQLSKLDNTVQDAGLYQGQVGGPRHAPADSSTRMCGQIPFWSWACQQVRWFARS